MDWLTTRPIAHRGLHDDVRPENTISSLEAAIDAGYPIECDVRLTADGVPVVVHDPVLRRLTGKDVAVENVSWTALREHSILGTAERVPRFGEVLDCVAGEVPLLVEVKSRGLPGDVEGAVTVALDSYDGEFAIQSFNPLTLAWFRVHRPSWPRGQLAGFLADVPVNPVVRLLLKHLAVSSVSDPDFVGYEHDRLPYRPVTRWRSRGKPVLAWTVRTEAAYRRVQPHADTVIFDDIRP